MAVDGHGKFVVAGDSEGSTDRPAVDECQAATYRCAAAHSGRSVSGQTPIGGAPKGLLQWRAHPTVTSRRAGSNGSSGTDSDGVSIEGQWYDATGATVGDEFEVNSYTTSQQRVPCGAGRFQWHFRGGVGEPRSRGSDSSSYSILGQRDDATGATVGDELEGGSAQHDEPPTVS